MSFISLTAQKLSHDVAAWDAFEKSDVPAGVDANIFQDAKRVISTRIEKRVLASLEVDPTGRAFHNLWGQQKRATNDRSEAIVEKAAHRRALAQAREIALADMI